MALQSLLDDKRNPDEAVTQQEANKINFTVKQAEDKEDRIKHGYVIVPDDDPTYFSEDVQRCVSTLGSYHDCPVCGKSFYIPPDSSSKWVYRLKGNRYGKGKQVCSYSCSRKGNK